MSPDLFTLPSKSFSKRLLKEYNEADHPRDEKGRWTAGGAARTAAAAGAALLGAAALGVPGARHLLPGVRRIFRPGMSTAAARRVMQDPTTAARLASPGLGNVSEATLRGAARSAFSPRGRFETGSSAAYRGLTGRYSQAARRRAMEASRSRAFHSPTGR